MVFVWSVLHWVDSALSSDKELSTHQIFRGIRQFYLRYKNNVRSVTGNNGIKNSVKSLLDTGYISVKADDEEYKIIQTHAEIWWQVIESIRNIIGRGPILAMAQNIALYHHEKYDGTGYPYGLKWKAIPLAARIVGIIDVIDVLKSKRVYKTECMSNDQVKNILIECSWNHFDPEIVDIILEHLEQILKLRDTLRD